jgi:hypothetical protein
MAASDRRSRLDAEEAYRCGREAVRLATAGVTGVMVNLLRPEGPYRTTLGTVPLLDVAGTPKPMRADFINAAGNFVTPAYFEYARPLVDPMEDLGTSTSPRSPRRVERPRRRGAAMDHVELAGRASTRRDLERRLAGAYYTPAVIAERLAAGAVAPVARRCPSGTRSAVTGASWSPGCERPPAPARSSGYGGSGSGIGIPPRSRPPGRPSSRRWDPSGAAPPSR